MTGTVVIEEKRSVIERFREWYKTKIVDTGKAKNFEEKFDKGIKIAKNVVHVVGGICTVVLAFIPADGVAGELIAAAATPALGKAVEAGGELVKEVVLDVKRGIEDGIVHADKGISQSENIKTSASPDEFIGKVNDAVNAGIGYKNETQNIHHSYQSNSKSNTHETYDGEVIDVDYVDVEENTMKR